MNDWNDPIARMQCQWDRQRWKKFCATWTMISLAESAAHNVMVAAHAPTEEQRLAGAREVANTIIGVLVVAMEALDS